MSSFSEKIFQGLVPTETDWVEHLKEAHKLVPSMTPPSFAPHPTQHGVNTYELLARVASQDASNENRDGVKIIDLACGDGHLLKYLLPNLDPSSKLFGIDMSDGELAVARKNFTDPRVSFINANAHALPFGDGEIDFVLCHMALMLMAPLDPVVREVARVLKPGGVFSAVVSNMSRMRGLYKEIRQTFSTFLEPRYPIIKQIRIGDARLGGNDGIKDIFASGRGVFANLEIEEADVQVGTDPDGAWEIFKDFYFFALLPTDVKQELKTILLKFLNDKQKQGQTLAFEMPMTKITVRKC